jgi:hypothetical protein
MPITIRPESQPYVEHGHVRVWSDSKLFTLVSAIATDDLYDQLGPASELVVDDTEDGAVVLEVRPDRSPWSFKDVLGEAYGRRSF